MNTCKNNKNNLSSIFLYSLNDDFNSIPSISKYNGPQQKHLLFSILRTHQLRSYNKICTEEIKIEKEIIEAITGGKHESLKPNSGEAIYFGENYVYVSFHDDTKEDCRVWEWHGQVVPYSEENGYAQEYVCGYYFEKMTNDVSYEEHDEERKEIEVGVGFKLRDFIGGLFWKNWSDVTL